MMKKQPKKEKAPETGDLPKYWMCFLLRMG